MKKIIILFFSFLLTFFYSANVIAQDRPTVEVVSAKQNGKNVDVTLNSSKPFIFGNNRYYLSIGSKEFFLYKQSHPNGKGIITFFIPENDFNNFQEGAAMFLTYGKVFAEGDGTPVKEEKTKLNRHAWSLGKFSKALLTK